MTGFLSCNIVAQRKKRKRLFMMLAHMPKHPSFFFSQVEGVNVIISNAWIEFGMLFQTRMMKLKAKFMKRACYCVALQPGPKKERRIKKKNWEKRELNMRILLPMLLFPCFCFLNVFWMSCHLWGWLWGFFFWFVFVLREANGKSGWRTRAL